MPVFRSNSPHFFFIVVASLMGIVFAATAQETEIQQYDFRTYSLGPAITDLFYYSDGDYQPVVIPNNQRSPQFDFKGRSKLGFYQQSTGAEGEIVYNEVASVQVDSRLKKVFVVFFPTRDDAGELVHRVYHVEDTFGTSASADWMVLNLTNKNLVTKIESDIEPFSLVPGKTHFVRPKPKPNNSYIFSVAEEISGEWKLVYNATWPHAPNKRAIVFILPRANNPKGIKLKRLYESIVPLSPAGAQP